MAVIAVAEFANIKNYAYFEMVKFKKKINYGRKQCKILNFVCM